MNSKTNKVNDLQVTSALDKDTHECILNKGENLFLNMNESESLEQYNIVNNTDEEFEKIRKERQREVDRLSLELLSNSKHYKKYIAKNCPEEQLKNIEDKHRFLKYKSRIAALLIELLDEYENDEQVSNHINAGPELQSMFKEMVQKTIQHLEWSEYSNSIKSNDFEEDDTMFANYRFNKPKSNFRKKRQTMEECPYSYWGATIRKSESTNHENSIVPTDKT